HFKIECLDEDIKTDLIRHKVYVPSDEAELNRIKYRTCARRFLENVIHATINPTLACNFECNYCFEKTHPNIYMTDEVEDKVVQFFKRFHAAKRLNVTWLGGEPLMAFHRIKSLTPKLLDLGVKYSASMVSNGYLLTKEVSDNLYNLKVGSIQITIDGLASIHNSRRCLKGGLPTFDKIIENIDYAQSVSPKTRISIRMNIDNSNIDNFYELYSFIKSRNYPNASIHPGFVKQLSDNAIGVCCDSTKVDFYKRVLKDHGLNFGCFYPESNRHECAVRNPNSLVIGPEGELYKCWNDIGDKSRIYGYIDGRISNEELLLEYLVGSDPFDDKNCRECVLLPVCSGGCPYDRIKNTADGKFQNCPLIKTNLEEFLWIHFKNKLSIIKKSELC
ncbi:MAG: SPASM domain-containing protein, partial [Muribaculum sp.]|nr:SPASM domain-containing protein [Muribaculum sp.]